MYREVSMGLMFGLRLTRLFAHVLLKVRLLIMKQQAIYLMEDLFRRSTTMDVFLLMREKHILLRNTLRFVFIELLILMQMAKYLNILLVKFSSGVHKQALLQLRNAILDKQRIYILTWTLQIIGMRTSQKDQQMILSSIWRKIPHTVEIRFHTRDL